MDFAWAQKQQPRYETRVLRGRDIRELWIVAFVVFRLTLLRMAFLAELASVCVWGQYVYQLAYPGCKSALLAPVFEAPAIPLF